jgi:hypothetical protein
VLVGGDVGVGVDVGGDVGVGGDAGIGGVHHPVGVVGVAAPVTPHEHSVLVAASSRWRCWRCCWQRRWRCGYTPQA